MSTVCICCTYHVTDRQMRLWVKNYSAWNLTFECRTMSLREVERERLLFGVLRFEGALWVRDHGPVCIGLTMCAVQVPHGLYYCPSFAIWCSLVRRPHPAFSVARWKVRGLGTRCHVIDFTITSASKLINVGTTNCNAMWLLSFHCLASSFSGLAGPNGWG